MLEEKFSLAGTADPLVLNGAGANVASRQSQPNA